MSAPRQADLRRPPSRLTSALRAAPELATIAILEYAISVALAALASEHPNLTAPAGPHEPPSLRAARRLGHHASALLVTLGRYRASVDAALVGVPLSLTDDLPF